MSDSVPPSPFSPPPPPPLPVDQNGQGPLNYYAGRSAPRVPTCVKVLAIIGIVISSLAIISLPMSLAAQALQKVARPTTQAAMHNPVEDIMSEPWIQGYQYVMNGVNFVMAIVQLVLCIGALKLLKWARGGMVKYNIVCLGLACVGTMFFLFAMLPRLVKVMNTMSGINQTVVMASLFGGVIGLVFAFVIPAIFIYYFTRPHVRAAFESQPVIKTA